MLVDFLWHFRGSVRIGSGASNASVIQSVADLLEQQRKEVTYRQGDYIEFDAPFWKNFYGSNWLALIMYDRGRLGIAEGPEGRSLRYDLRSFDAFMWSLLAMPLFGTFFWISEGTAAGVWMGAAAFAWIYGVNFLIAAFRVPAKIRRAVERA